MIALIGLLFVFVIPGLLLTLILFREHSLLEKILFTIIFSIAVTVVLGMLLGFNESTYNITGGLTTQNIWAAMVSFSAILLLIYLFKEKKVKEKNGKIRKKK